MDPHHAALHPEVTTAPDGFKRAMTPSQVARFSEWAPKPLPDSNLTRRVTYFPWSRGFWAIVLVAIWLWAIAMMAVLFPGSAIPLFFTTWGILIPGMQILIRKNSRPAPLYLVELLDVPSAIPQFPVEVRYSVAGVKSGLDRGVVSFFDGWLHFQGRRTSWSLQATDCICTTRRKLDLDAWQEIAQEMRWRHNNADFMVEMLPYDQLEGRGNGLRKKVQMGFMRWSQGGDEVLEQYTKPPTSPMPETLADAEWLRRRVGRLRWVGLALCVGSLLAGGDISTLSTWSLGVGVLIFAIGVWARVVGGTALATFAKYCG